MRTSVQRLAESDQAHCARLPAVVPPELFPPKLQTFLPSFIYIKSVPRNGLYLRAPHFLTFRAENNAFTSKIQQKHDSTTRFSLTLHAGFRRHALFGNTNHTKQTGKMEQDTTNGAKTELIYGLNDRPPLRETLFAALQHLLAIFVAIIPPPLIIAGALKLDVETTSFLVSMAPSTNCQRM